MGNIYVKIKKKTREVNPKQIFIGLDGENLQENLIFSFEDEFVDGQARLDIEFRDETKGQITDIQKNGETYVLPIKSEITKYSGCKVQLVITEGTNENAIPIFKSLYVGLIVEESINASTPIPEGYTEWIDRANTKLNQIDQKIEEVDTAVEEVNNAVERVNEGLSDLTYANEEAREIVSEFENNVESYTDDFNTNANNKTNLFNSNASEKTTNFNDNADSKLSSYNSNASSKLSEYNSNAETKTSDYNTNASSKLNTYNSNAETKLSDYNTNATNKLNAYNENATTKLGEYNTNASTKLEEYNQNASDKIDEYDEHVDEMQEKIDNLEERVEDLEDNQITLPAEGTEIHVEDAAKARLYDFELEKESSQDNVAYVDVGEWEQGTIDAYTGTDINNNSCVRTKEYIRIFPNVLYSLSRSIYTSYMNFRFYDINKNYIGYQSSSVMTSNKTNNRMEVNDSTMTFTLIDTNIAYMRLNDFSNNLNTIYTISTENTPSPDYPQEVKTVKGYRNLFDKDNATYVNRLAYNNDFTAFQGTSEYTPVRVYYLQCEPNTTYTYSKSLGTYCRFGSCVNVPANDVPKTVLNNDSSAPYATITTGASDNYIFFSPLKSSELDTYNFDDVIATVQITESNEVLPYVPYGNNYVDVKVIGKNLNTSDLEIGSINGATGENQSNNSYTRSKDYIALQSNTEYTISSSIQALIGLRYYDKNKNFISGVSATAQPKTFTTPENCYYFRYVLTINDLTNLIQIEEGSTATTYEAYKESNVPIPLNNNEIVGIGDYKDELKVDESGHVFINKKTGKVVLDGTEESGWNFSSTSNAPFQYYLDENCYLTESNSSLPLLYCNQYARKSYYSTWSNYKYLITAQTTTTRLFFRNVDIDTLENFKLYASTHNIIVYYVLATPETIDLQTTVDLSLFKGVNNVSNSEDGYMSIRYVESIESVISKIEERLSALEEE